MLRFASVKLLWKAVFTVVIAFAMCPSASAQKVYEDVILLNTAEVLRGEITENVPPDDVTILLNDSTVRVVPRGEIVKILKEVKRNFKDEKSSTAPEEYAPKQVSFAGILQAGFGTDIEVAGYNYFRANVIAGFRSGRALTFGLGTGIRAFTEFNRTAVPLFADLRFSSQHPKVAPIFAVGAGTVFHPYADWDNNGTILSFEGGIRLGETPGVGFIITLGYERFTSLTEPERGTSRGFFPAPFVRRSDVINAFTVNLAITF